MIHGRGYATGYELSRVLGIPRISHETLREFAEATRTLMQRAGFAPIEPEFNENFCEGWLMQLQLHTERQAPV